MDNKNGKNKPNVLILYSDQHSAKALGCYGNQVVKTPHLDKLAQNGVLFERAYTQNPICTPSRMSFLSGQYVHNFGYYGLMGPCPQHLPSLFSYFKEAGYRTGLSGKTHTPSGWLSPFVDDLADGFGYEMKLTKHLYPLTEGLQGIKYNDYNLYLQNKGLLDKRDDKIYPEWLEKHGHCAGQGLDAKISSLAKEDTIEAWSAKRAVDFIVNCSDQDTPFLYWMTVPRPHQTYVPAKEFWDLYDEDLLELAPNANNPMEARHPSAQKQQKYFKSTDAWMSFEPKHYDAARKRVLHGYYANVSQVDDAIGEVISAIDAHGLREKTIILYLTDHGEFAGEHGMIEKAPGIGFHCVTQIPSILSWKSVLPENVRRDALIESIDWFPTLCHLCKLPVPEFVDGDNIISTISDGKSLKNYAFTENAYAKTVHSKKYKYTQYLPETAKGEAFGELFDLEEDPFELNNLFFRSDYQAVVADLRQALLEWLVRTTRCVTLNPSIVNQEGLAGDWGIENNYVAEDGKIKNSYIQKLIENENFNYF